MLELRADIGKRPINPVVDGFDAGVAERARDLIGWHLIDDVELHGKPIVRWEGIKSSSQYLLLLAGYRWIGRWIVACRRGDSQRGRNPAARRPL